MSLRSAFFWQTAIIYLLVKTHNTKNMSVTLEVDFNDMIKQCLSHAQMQAKALEELVISGPDAQQKIFEIFKHSSSYEEAEEKLKSRFKLSKETANILMETSLSELTNPDGCLEYYKKAAELLSVISESYDESGF